MPFRPAPSRRPLARPLVASLAVLAAPLALAQTDPTIFVAPGKSAGNDGTSPANAVPTVADAVARLKGRKGLIKVAAGTIMEAGAIALPSGVRVEGSWDAQFQKQAALTSRLLDRLTQDDELCAEHTCLTTKGADRVVTISQPGVTLAQLVVLGPDRSAQMGSSTYGVVVDGVDASLAGVVVKAGTAGTGRTGETGAPGSGTCTSGGSGGWMKNIQQGGVSDFCEPQAAGQGQTVQVYDRVANGGRGGDFVESNCSLWPSISRVSDGTRGGRGDNGIEGPPGTATEPDEGHFARNDGELQWAGATQGGPGNPGSAGGGGGGGGPGSSWNVIYWCLVGYPVMGGSGHTGNNGGCGGGGGHGGYPGGASVALVVNEGTVGISDVVLFGGQAGRGGVGGSGAGGAPGQDDATAGSAGSSTTGCSSNESHGGRGGAGGPGGAGGGGGGGAGGNGGAAFTVVKLGKGAVVHGQASGVFRVLGGAAGSGGPGGVSADSQTIAPSGNDGAHATEATIELK